MLPNADVGYLFDYKRNESMERSENLHSEDGLGIGAKSVYQQLSFFGYGFMVNAQSVISCVKKEVGDCLEALDRIARMDEYASDSDSESQEETENINGILSMTMLDRSNPALEGHPSKKFFDGFLQTLQNYKTLYSKISNLPTAYVVQSQQSNAKWLASFIPTAISGSQSDRQSEVKFITELLSQEDIINDPYAFDEMSFNKQSIDWYQENTKKLLRSNAILVGACTYVHKKIAQEYKDKEPTSALYLILSKILNDLDCIEKSSALAFLLKSAQLNTISLSLPKICSSQEPETFSNFEENCQNFIRLLDKERKEAELEAVHENSLLTL